MKILLIEDDEPTALALKEALSAYHYTVTIASDGQTGAEKTLNPPAAKPPAPTPLALPTVSSSLSH
jgi:DNA-binding response OmpR family regulator